MRDAPPAARMERGFTLIEMLVVLMIMGLFLGLVSTITRPDERALLRLEAERLSQLLDFAAAEAQLFDLLAPSLGLGRLRLRRFRLIVHADYVSKARSLSHFRSLVFNFFFRK